MSRKREFLPKKEKKTEIPYKRLRGDITVSRDRCKILQKIVCARVACSLSGYLVCVCYRNSRNLNRLSQQFQLKNNLANVQKISQFFIKKKHVIRQEHGSETSSPFRKLWPTDQPTKLTDRRRHRVLGKFNFQKLPNTQSSFISILIKLCKLFWLLNRYWGGKEAGLRREIIKTEWPRDNWMKTLPKGKVCQF